MMYLMPTTASMPTPLPSRTEYALAYIKGAILGGRLSQGQALVETEIASELGISKTPVREALKTLERSGLVIVRPYLGTRVRELNRDDAIAIYETRLLLEPEAVRSSVGRGVDVARAREALAEAEAAADAPARSLANRAFHASLWANCGNHVMVDILEGLRDQTALVTVATWNRDPRWRDEAGQHLEILDAAQRGDAETASRITYIHIKNFLDRLPEGKQAV